MLYLLNYYQKLGIDNNRIKPKYKYGRNTNSGWL